VVSADGREQVTGFHMAGELVGMDGISSEQHSCDTVALEDTEVCVIPYDRIEEVAASVPALRSHFHKVMSREIVREHGVMLLLGSMHAEERLAAFLLNLSQRFEARGYSRSEFVLRMTRAEIGSFLGLKLETVSRALSRFAADSMIEVNQKHVRIVDPDGLRSIMAGQGTHCEPRSAG
jgi:CRP/FNR family transcriptional regulator